MAASQGVGTAQSDNLAVIETHTPEDGAQVVAAFGAVGQAPVGGAHADVAVGAAGAPGDGGALHFLDGGYAGEGPEVGVGYPGVLLWDGMSIFGIDINFDMKRRRRRRRKSLTFDRLQEITSSFQASIGSVVTFGSEPHRGTI